jgi:type III secretion protein SpaR/YscT/HrcT
MEFTPELQALLLSVAFALPRFIGALMVLPTTASELMPTSVRTGLAVVCAAFVSPVIAPSVPLIQSGGWMMLVLTVLKEAGIGAAVGFAFGCIIWSFEAFGALADFTTGQENSSVFNPLSQEQSSTYSRFFSLFATMIFLLAGGLTIMLGILSTSFTWWPIQAFSPDILGMIGVITQFSIQMFFELFLRLSIGLIGIVLLVDLFFGLANKYAQGLNVFQLGFPVKGVLALLCMVLTISTSSDMEVNMMDAISAKIRETLGANQLPR